MIDENAPHQPRTNGKEVGPVVPAYAVEIYQSQINFIDQSRGLKGVTVSLPGHVALGCLAQFAIDEWG